MKGIAVVLACHLLAVAAFSQPTKVTNELTLAEGVGRHEGIDDIYRKFSKAYSELDASVFETLYSKNAAYLVPGNNIEVGSEGIARSFQDFFKTLRAQDARVAIAFHIVQRRVETNLGYDVGIYTLKTSKGGKEVNSGKGKFVVVAVRVGREWKFQVDGYSNLPVDKSKQ